MLIEEVKSFNKESGKNFDIAKSIKKQLPSFACINCLYDNKVQRAIQRYMYCKEFNVSPYKGSYGEQPSKWVDKSFVIKNALAKREKEQIDAQRQRTNNN